jgi:hypothetical protein
MFRAFSRPSSGAQLLQWQSLVLSSYRGDSRAVFVVGPVGPVRIKQSLGEAYCFSWLHVECHRTVDVFIQTVAASRMPV